MSSRAAAAGARRRAASIQSVEPAPVPKAGDRPEPAPAPVRAPLRVRTDQPNQTTKASLTVPTTTAYVGVVVILGLCLLSYVLGYSLGEGAGRRYMMDAGMGAQAPGLEQTPITDPILDGTTGGTTLSREAQTPTRSPPVEPVRTPAQASTGSGDILTPEGRVGVDPREAGVNYLQMGDLPEDQAVSAIEFFGGEGEVVIGVPLEDRGAGSNDRFRLFSLSVPIPSERWSEMGRERREHLRRVADIGRRWQREKRGGTDFASAYYAKYAP